MTVQSAPILTLHLPARFRVGWDQLGYRIEITDKAAVRPDLWGRVTNILYEEGQNPRQYARDAALVRRLIEYTFRPSERLPVFKNPMGDRRRKALEAICEAANDIYHAREYDEWLGPRQ